MKVLIIVLLASLAAAQQLQSRRQNNFQGRGTTSNFNRDYYSPNQFANNNRFRSNPYFSNQSRNQYQQQNRYQQQNQYQQSNFQDYQDEIFGVFEPLNLPSGASFMLGDISPSFSCADRPYGYYADVDNFCRVFHVCNPTVYSDGTVQTYQYSMLCGEGTQFDQRSQTCVTERAASPCQDSPNWYWKNELFALPHEKQ